MRVIPVRRGGRSGCTELGGMARTPLLGWKALGAIEPDVLTVEVRILDDGLDQMSEFCRTPHAIREHDRGQQRVEDRWRGVAHDLSDHRARCDGAHPSPA